MPLVSLPKEESISDDQGEAISAPPPKPMIAVPVAMPGRSGNHFISVDTGEMYPMPRPTPPMTPYPKMTSQYWRVATPSEAIRKPEEKVTSDTNIAHLGPLRSTSVPPKAAERPRTRMAIWKGSALAVPEMSRAFSSGVLKTLQAYAWPMEK